MIDFGFDLAGRRDKRLVRGALLSSLGAIAETLPILVTFVVLDGVFRGTARESWIGWSLAAILASILATWLFKAVGGVDNFSATFSLVCDLRLRLIDHLRRLPMGFWSKQRTGTVNSIVTDEFAFYTEVVTHAWGLVVTNLVQPIAIAVILLCVDWRLGLVSIATIPFAVLAIPWSYRLLNRASDRLSAVRGRVFAQTVEYIQGIATLREYGQSGPYHERLAAGFMDLERQMMRAELAPAPALFTYKLLSWLGFSLAVAVGAWMVAHAQLSPSRLLLFALLSIRLYGALDDLGSFLAAGRFASRTLARIRELFDEPVQVEVDRPRVPADDRIELKGVHFSYTEPGDQGEEGGGRVLRGIDATFEPGTVTAFVGPSGSGKTTLAHLLARLWDVDEGSVEFGGVDVREMELSALQRRVSMVFQDVVLFQESVEDNIRLARPDASRADVVAAARAARAHSFIETLPQGYETVLGEGGHDLSGGQRQRLSIARALLEDAPILILDEATSSVDSDNEHLIQQAISELTAERTVLVVAHRLWTVQHADQILVLDQGVIVQRGTHAELVGCEGLYRRMWEAQQETRTWRLETGAT